MLLLIAAAAQGGCDDEARLARRAEAERITHSVRELREAEGSKVSALDRLRSQNCGDPKLCELRDVCVDGYTQHQRGKDATLALSRGLSQDAAADGAALQLSLAEKDLREARVKTRRCADLEAEARREHGLK
ncbi:MAG: hypothetical protein R3B13_40180 [Polyangiaceae bacterium]